MYSKLEPTPQFLELIDKAWCIMPFDTIYSQSSLGFNTDVLVVHLVKLSTATYQCITCIFFNLLPPF